jgi:hypothetical protein
MTTTKKKGIFCKYHGRIKRPTRSGTCRSCAEEATREGTLLPALRQDLRRALRPPKKRSEAQLATARLKRSRPDGTSLKAWAQEHPLGPAWLERKHASV